jgi:D-aminopeptidase
MYVMNETHGSGSMISTADDMLRWLAHLRSSRKIVGSPASWALMVEPAVLSTGTVIGYGLGLMSEPYRGVSTLHHSGGWIGGSSQMITVPDHALDIIVMVNGAPVQPVLLAMQIMDALLGDQLPEPPEQRVDASRYPALVGQRYHSPSTGAVAEFAEVTGKLGVAKLSLGWIGHPPTPLRDGAKGPWLPSQDIAAGPVELDAAGCDGNTAPARITIADGGHPQVMHRLVAEEAPSAADLAPQLVGDYRVPDLKATARIALNGERLVLHIQGQHGQVDMHLKPLSADVMSCVAADPMLAAYGGGLVNVDRRGSDVIGLRMDNLRTRHIRLFRLLTEETAA